MTRDRISRLKIMIDYMSLTAKSCPQSCVSHTVEPVLLHNIRQDTFYAVRQVYAVQPEMRKTYDIELDT